MSITFAKQAKEFHSHLKSILDTIPKEQVKYRSNKNIAITFHCYCQSLESIRPIVDNVLEKTQMYVRFGMIPDKQISTADLWKQGALVLEK